MVGDRQDGGGLGNLIALPLQGAARQVGNSVFIDDALAPFPVQWAFLARQARIAASTFEALVAEVSRTGRILAVHLPTDEDDAEQCLRRRRVRRSGLRQPTARCIPS